MAFGGRSPRRRGETSERAGPGWASPRRPPSGPPIKGGGGGAGRARAAAASAGLSGPAARPRAPRTRPAGAMRARELRLALLALVLCQAARGPAAPLPGPGGPAVAKMYPRGNHWAVGHLMGKKSTEESPDAFEPGSLQEQLREYLGWEAAARNLLHVMKAQETRGHQSPHPQPLGSGQSAPWDGVERQDLKGWGDTPHQVLHKEEDAHT
ncbi:gastrin-releasing peptide [Sorex araneus]|uniref:gastrin-releasing peptide n=1 Tax=Sorex araneus TaxID=42254 RepID=UPI0024335460|nr:gastrin-releasing peptide [Sorex araneus]